MTVVVMQHLAALKFDQGKIKEAVSLALKTQPLSENVLKNILSFGSEHQRLAYQKRSYPSYDLLARVANKTGNAKPLANAILHNKGVVLDSLIEDSQVVGAPKVKEEIQSLKWRLMKLWMTIPKDDAAAKAKPVSQLEQLEMQLKKLESGLARQVGEARQALEIEFQEVQAVLPEGSVLVEFIRYKHFVGLRDTEAYYGAVIIPKTGDPIWVPLGKADALEKKILDYQKMMRCKKDKKNDCQRYDEQAVTQLLIDNQILDEHHKEFSARQYAQGFYRFYLYHSRLRDFYSQRQCRLDVGIKFGSWKLAGWMVGSTAFRQKRGEGDSLCSILGYFHHGAEINYTIIMAKSSNSPPPKTGSLPDSSSDNTAPLLMAAIRLMKNEKWNISPEGAYY